MSHGQRPLAVLCGLAFLVLAPGASGQEIRLGVEFQVNSYTTGSQETPAVAMGSNGDFIVAWESEAQDGQLTGVFARRFSSAGLALGTEFQVNSYTLTEQFAPAVAANNAGFVVAWNSRNGQDGEGPGIFARRFSTTGSAIASEFQVNVRTIFSQTNPAVAIDADGDFVVAWTSYFPGATDEVFARRFTSAGDSSGTEFRVNSHTLSSQIRPSIAAAPGGSFVVAWDSLRDGGTFGVFAQRFASSGSPLAAEFQVNTYTIDNQYQPAVAGDGDGDFVVTWLSMFEDGSSQGIFARRFSSAGAPITGELLVNDYTLNSQFSPAVTSESDGDFIVSWTGVGPEDTYGVAARRFASNGSPFGPQFLVNSHTADYQGPPAIAGSGLAFVVAWTSEFQDGNGESVFGRRFRVLAALDLDGNGAIAPLTDTLLALRYAFGFRGAVLIDGAVDLAGCTRCTAPAIEAHIDSLTH